MKTILILLFTLMFASCSEAALDLSSFLDIEDQEKVETELQNETTKETTSSPVSPDNSETETSETTDKENQDTTSKIEETSPNSPQTGVTPNTEQDSTESVPTEDVLNQPSFTPEPEVIPEPTPEIEVTPKPELTPEIEVTPKPEPTPPTTQIPNQNFTGEVWVTGVSQNSGWIDVDKKQGYYYPEQNTCWMAAAATVIQDFNRRHNKVAGVDAVAIYKEFTKKYGDKAGTYFDVLPEYIVEKKLGPVDAPFIGRTKGTCLWETTDDINLMSEALRNNLAKGAAAIKFVWERGGGTGHALTLWGAAFQNGKLTKIYITDSDYNVNQIKGYNVEQRNGKIEVLGYEGGGAYFTEAYIPY